jgi:hypothetical protein
LFFRRGRVAPTDLDAKGEQMRGKEVFDLRLRLEVSTAEGLVFAADLVNRATGRIEESVSASNTTILFKALSETGYKASSFFIKGEDGFWQPVES